MPIMRYRENHRRFLDNQLLHVPQVASGKSSYLKQPGVAGSGFPGSASIYRPSRNPYNRDPLARRILPPVPGKSRRSRLSGKSPSKALVPAGPVISHTSTPRGVPGSSKLTVSNVAVSNKIPMISGSRQSLKETPRGRAKSKAKTPMYPPARSSKLPVPYAPATTSKTAVGYMPKGPSPAATPARSTSVGGFRAGANTGYPPGRHAKFPQTKPAALSRAAKMTPRLARFGRFGVLAAGAANLAAVGYMAYDMWQNRGRKDPPKIAPPAPTPQPPAPAPQPPAPAAPTPPKVITKPKAPTPLPSRPRRGRGGVGRVAAKPAPAPKKEKPSPWQQATPYIVGGLSGLVVSQLLNKRNRKPAQVNSYYFR